VDKSPFQQGKTLMERTVVAPEQLPAQVRTLYVGLNPVIAREALRDASWLNAERVRLVFLSASPI
jgi:hypothetical protein